MTKECLGKLGRLVERVSSALGIPCFFPQGKYVFCESSRYGVISNNGCEQCSPNKVVHKDW